MSKPKIGFQIESVDEASDQWLAGNTWKLVCDDWDGQSLDVAFFEDRQLADEVCEMLNMAIADAAEALALLN